MPRASAYEKHYTTKPMLFAQTVVGTPTRWHTDAGHWVSHFGGHHYHVIWRLWVRRNGKGLYIETRHDSPDFPKEIRLISRSKLHLAAMHKSGVMLCRMSVRDPSSSVTQPVYMYDRSHPDALDGKMHLRTVAQGLESVFMPRAGRPRKLVDVESIQVGVPAALRVRRRQEFLTRLDRTIDILEPLAERAQDARKLRCYTDTQRLEIRNGILNGLRTLQAVRHMIYNDTFTQEQEQASKPLTIDQLLGQAEDSATPAAPTPEARKPFTIDMTKFDNP